MNKFLLTAALSAAVFGQSALAGNVTGGSVGFDYSAFTEDSAGTLEKSTLSSSLEYGFDRTFAIQGDLSLTHFGLSEYDAGNLTLHGIYHFNESTSLGAFIGRDTIENEGLTFYGLEAGHEVGQISGETYIAYAEDSGVDGTLFGLAGMYDVNDAFGLGVSYDRLDVEDLDADRITLEAEYRLQGFVISAEFGQAEIGGLGSENFFGIGARMTFGAKRGSTFGQRGLIDVLPGL